MGNGVGPRKKGYGKSPKVIFGQVPNLPADGYRRKKPAGMSDEKWLKTEQLRKTKKYNEDNKKGETGGGIEPEKTNKQYGSPEKTNKQYGSPRKPRW